MHHLHTNASPSTKLFYRWHAIGEKGVNSDKVQIIHAQNYTPAGIKNQGWWQWWVNDHDDDNTDNGNDDDYDHYDESDHI